MAAVLQFNSTVFDFIRDLRSALKDHAELAMAETLMNAYFKTQPRTRLVLDKFWEIAKDRRAEIDARDRGALLDTMEALFQRRDLIDNVWGSLSEENRDVVFRYLAALHDLAGEAVQGREIVTITSAPEESDDKGGLYVVYNNMWKEFLALLKKSLHDSDDATERLQECLDRLDGLTAKKGQDSDIIFALLTPSLQRALPGVTEMSQEKLIQYMVPPSDPIEILQSDANLLTLRFALSKTMTVHDVLECVITSEEVAALSTYWHFLKVVTFTIKSCPKEVLAMVSNLARSMTDGIQSGDGGTISLTDMLF